MGTIIKNGKIWFERAWINGALYIEDGLVKKIFKEENAQEILKDLRNNQVVDAKGMIVLPGLIDIHVHLREPGFEHKETIETGTKAAVKGGFTSIAAMPNTKPIMDSPRLLSSIIQTVKEQGSAKVYPIAAITYGELGEEVVNMSELKNAGAIGFSDDGKGIQSTGLMKKAMEEAAKNHLPIIAHCEDLDLLEGGVIHDGAKAKELGLPGISSASEYIQLARDLELAEHTGVHYHVCHVSTKRSVELIRQAKQRGIKVTAEVSPHHLILTENDLKEPLSQFKMNPPLRSIEDQKALIEGLLDGTIDVIATDHAPHSAEEKELGILSAPFGIVGLETAFPLLYTYFVQKGIVQLEQLIEWLTIKPAQIIGIKGGYLEAGSPADLTIIDLNRQERVNTESFLSKGKNTPFANWNLFGWPKLTMVNGEIQWMDKEVEISHE